MSASARRPAVPATDLPRCDWGRGDPIMQAYHDNEWGTPVHADQRLFEFIVLEGAQAGLSWRTVLAKRAHYRKVFHQFAIDSVAGMTDRELERTLLDPGIIRNRLKVFHARDNARAVMQIIGEFGSLDRYLWSFVDGQPLLNHWRRQADVPASTPLSDKMSKELRKRGLHFVGTTICYSFMQATGMVDDHLVGCFRHSRV